MDKLARGVKKVVTKTVTGQSNKAITFKSANLAKFSDGACTCSLGETNVLVTAVCENSKQSSGGFTPFTVDYKQKAAAAGRIPLTHIRRDIGFSESEILTSRMIDRSVRPGFDIGFNRTTQVVCNLLSVDGHNDPDILAINGASASLSISDIPWNGPIGAVRMGLVGEILVPNPTRKEQEESRVNLVIASNANGNIMMLEGFCREPVLLNDIVKAIKSGVKKCNSVIDSIKKLQIDVGKPKRELDQSHKPTPEHINYVYDNARQRLETILTDYSLDKVSRDKRMKEVHEPLLEDFKSAFPTGDHIPAQFYEAFKSAVRKCYVDILKQKRLRCDGRKFTEIRPINCEIDLYKPLHGSALFQRGQTQVFCSATFDSPDTSFKNDPITLLTSGIKEKNFMLHYEFPPFATNEVGRIGSLPGRREIGHGALAERALRPMIPDNHDMTIRLNCEVLESNGSSSMASVCAGSLSLMDASVDIKENVAGVSVGLFKDESNWDEENEIILTDILGFEDYIGDMDFKIAGTKRAITALQLDVKPTFGIPPKILYKALNHGHTAKEKIITIMNGVIRQPREVKKKNHPILKTIYIPAHKKSKFIGLGGSNLKKLTAHIGVKITMLDETVEGNFDDKEGRGNAVLFAPNKDALEEAEDFIQKLLERETREPELDFNGIYSATIEEIRPNGVMVTLYPNMTPTLLHNSQLDIRAVSHPSALNLSVGQQIQVKYFGRDPASGQMRLSRKTLQISGTSKTHTL